MIPPAYNLDGLSPMFERDGARRSVFDSLMLCAALGTAAVDTSTGTIAAVVAVIWVLLRQGAALIARPQTIDILTFVAAGIVLASPYWTPGELDDLAKASHGPAISLVFMIAVRRVLSNAENLTTFLRGIVAVTSTYAAYFIASGQILSIGAARLTVAFANPNYTAAVLTFGLAVSLFLIHRAQSRMIRVIGALVVAIHGWAILMTGSRASLAGAALAVGVILIGPSVRAYKASTWALIAAFSAGFIPQLDTSTLAISKALSNLPYVGRDEAAVLTGSGRIELWASTRSVIGESWLVGWGPERYRFQPGGPEYLAHSWGLEYMASVGLLGTIFLVAVFAIAYREPYRRRSRDGILLTAATALAIAPSLMLSTHQWTLWFWAAVGIWSRSDIKGASQLVVRPSLPDARPGAPRSERHQTTPQRSSGNSASSARDLHGSCPQPD